MRSVPGGHDDYVDQFAGMDLNFGRDGNGEGEAALDGVVEAPQAEGRGDEFEVGADAGDLGLADLTQGAAGSDFDGHARAGFDGQGLAHITDDALGFRCGDI